MELDRLGGDDQFGCDLLVRCPVHHPECDLALLGVSVDGSSIGERRVSPLARNESPEAVADYFASNVDGDWHQIIRSSSGGTEFVAYAREEDGSGDQITLTVAEANGQTEGSAQVVLYK